MTIKQQILDHLRQSKQALTDRQIASRIGRPLPSVRRARLELEREDLVFHYFGAGSGFNPLTWKAKS